MSSGSGVLYVCFFLFKQKTAYEMRISDWSSDVCSSDLLRLAPDHPALGAWRRQIIQGHRRSLGADHGIRPTWTLGRHTLPSVIAVEAATCLEPGELTHGDLRKP